jgi:L-2,4-diaminobutyrate decarboxylase
MGKPLCVCPTNLGVLGSHGAAATALVATFLAWGQQGICQRIEHCMALAHKLGEFVSARDRLRLYAQPETGIVVWRPKDESLMDPIQYQLPVGSTSTTTISGVKWFRNVAANPNADVDLLIDVIERILAETT